MKFSQNVPSQWGTCTWQNYLLPRIVFLLTHAFGVNYDKKEVKKKLKKVHEQLLSQFLLMIHSEVQTNVSYL